MKSVRMLAGGATLITTLFCVGCASILSRSEYNILLRSNADAEVEIREHGNLVATTRTTQTMTLSAKSAFFVPARYSFTFKKAGYPDVTKERNAYLDGWYFGNLIFGGLLGILIVDPATGAMWHLDENPIVINYEPMEMNETGVNQ